MEVEYPSFTLIEPEDIKRWDNIDNVSAEANIETILTEQSPLEVGNFESDFQLISDPASFEFHDSHLCQLTNLEPVDVSADHLPPILEFPKEGFEFGEEYPDFSLTSPTPSDISFTTASLESPTDSDDLTSTALPPHKVFAECKRKRGRRPKSEAHLYPSSKEMKQPRVKVYEIESPLEDKELERKRLNAVNAKRHRDQQKQSLATIQEQLKEVSGERDKLRQTLESLKKREAELQQKVDHFKSKASSLLSDIEFW